MGGKRLPLILNILTDQDAIACAYIGERMAYRDADLGFLWHIIIPVQTAPITPSWAIYTGGETEMRL